MNECARVSVLVLIRKLVLQGLGDLCADSAGRRVISLILCGFA